MTDNHMHFNNNRLKKEEQYIVFYVPLSYLQVTVANDFRRNYAKNMKVIELR